LFILTPQINPFLLTESLDQEKNPHESIL